MGLGEEAAEAGGEAREEEEPQGRLGLEMAEDDAMELLGRLARDFNVRDPRKLYQIARREFPERRDLTSARAQAALRSDVARQVLAPSLGAWGSRRPRGRTIGCRRTSWIFPRTLEGRTSTGWW